jgi:hypothetical protein
MQDVFLYMEYGMHISYRCYSLVHKEQVVHIMEIVSLQFDSHKKTEK